MKYFYLIGTIVTAIAFITTLTSGNTSEILGWFSAMCLSISLTIKVFTEDEE